MMDGSILSTTNEVSFSSLRAGPILVADQSSGRADEGLREVSCRHAAVARGASNRSRIVRSQFQPGAGRDNRAWILVVKVGSTTGVNSGECLIGSVVRPRRATVKTACGGSGLYFEQAALISWLRSQTATSRGNRNYFCAGTEAVSSCVALKAGGSEVVTGSSARCPTG
jgi:hypothetical protein